MRIYKLLILSILISNFSYCQTLPEISEFVISECKENCFIEANLDSISLSKDTLILVAGVNLNCCGNYYGTFEFKTSDTLNLIITNEPNIDGIIESCSCNCYYVLKYKIKYANLIPNIVLINGQTFEENRNDAGWQISNKVRVKEE